MAEHISKTGKCKRCGRDIEYVDGIRDPFWRHVDMRDTGMPHAAQPAE